MFVEFLSFFEIGKTEIRKMCINVDIGLYWVAACTAINPGSA
jgi:hypothetical protein